MTRTTPKIKYLVAAAIAAWFLAFRRHTTAGAGRRQTLVLGSFENSGSVTFGYRLDSVSGYKPEYQELFDLQSGPRLLDFSLFGHVSDGKNPLSTTTPLLRMESAANRGAQSR